MKCYGSIRPRCSARSTQQMKSCEFYDRGINGICNHRTKYAEIATCKSVDCAKYALVSIAKD